MNSKKLNRTKKRQSSEKPADEIDEKKACTSNVGVVCSKYFNSKDQSNGDADKDSQPKTDTKLTFKFFDRPCTDLAKILLGKKFVRKLQDDNIVEANIVETEAYLGGEDKAAHSYNGKRTQRNEAMYMKPGTIYVYNIYGMYSCINISAQGILHIHELHPVNLNKICNFSVYTSSFL